MVDDMPVWQSGPLRSISPRYGEILAHYVSYLFVEGDVR